MNVSIVIPNYNGIKYLAGCLDSLRNQTGYAFETIVVDNGSTDGSFELLEAYPEIKVIRFKTNQGFCTAVNAGIKAADFDYVILLNNDTLVRDGFVNELVTAIEQNERIFSVSSKMLMLHEPEKIDDAGDMYCAFGWAFARGKGRTAEDYETPCTIFAACGGAAIYRKCVFEEIGYFDEKHFAYLEDMDIGYRARIYGYINRYEPKAQVLHAGSGVSGSRYNEFKVNLSSANSVYIIGKNMPLLQVILNLPFLIAGFTIKIMFFILKGMGITYIKGLWRGLKLCFSKEGRQRHIPFRMSHLGNYIRIQLELWWNIIVRLIG